MTPGSAGVKTDPGIRAPKPLPTVTECGKICSLLYVSILDIFLAYLFQILYLNSEKRCKEYSMGAISLKLSEDLLAESDRWAEVLHIPRAEYIRRAIARMNREVEAQFRADRLAAASHKVRQESMQVNAEFAAFETEPDA